jgi:ketosteroid isomerase-like protein
MSTDNQDIIDLTIAYCWTIDTKDFSNLHNIFTADATAALGDERIGIESIIDKIRTALTPLDASQHLVSNHQVHVNGDTATCRCYLQAQHVRKAASGGPNFIIAGRYHDTLIRTEHGWRITRRELHRDWSDGNISVVRPGATSQVGPSVAN